MGGGAAPSGADDGGSCAARRGRAGGATGVQATASALCVRRVYRGGATRLVVIGDVFYFSSPRYRVHDHALIYPERSLVVLCGGSAALRAEGRLADGSSGCDSGSAPLRARSRAVAAAHVAGAVCCSAGTVRRARPSKWRQGGSCAVHPHHPRSEPRAQEGKTIILRQPRYHTHHSHTPAERGAPCHTPQRKLAHDPCRA